MAQWGLTVKDLLKDLLMAIKYFSFTQNEVSPDPLVTLVVYVFWKFMWFEYSEPQKHFLVVYVSNAEYCCKYRANADN